MLVANTPMGCTQAKSRLGMWPTSFKPMAQKHRSTQAQCTKRDQAAGLLLKKTNGAIMKPNSSTMQRAVEPQDVQMFAGVERLRETAEDSLTAALNQGFPVEHLSALRAGFAAIVCCFAEQVVSNVWWDQCSIAGSSCYALEEILVGAQRRATEIKKRRGRNASPEMGLSRVLPRITHYIQTQLWVPLDERSREPGKLVIRDIEKLERQLAQLMRKLCQVVFRDIYR